MKIAFLLAATILSASAAQAADLPVVITQNPQTVAVPMIGNVVAGDAAGERGGSGYTAITNVAPRGAASTPGSNGSLEIRGDRSRYVIGNIYGGPALLTLDQLSSLTFDYRIDDSGTRLFNTPVARVHIIDGTVRSEMIWEGIYNGVNDATEGAWANAGASSAYYLNVRTNGATFTGGNPGYTLANGTDGTVLLNGSQVNRTIADWAAGSQFSSAAYITGFSFGAGSGFGSDFVGFVDNVRVTSGANAAVINFETGAVAAVPEPASWAMMIGGFGLVGGAMRRRGVAKLARA